jgi:hypothetical protein
MFRHLTQSVLGVAARRPRRSRSCSRPMAAMEALEDRSLLSANCVTSCVVTWTPSRCTPNPCSSPVRLCNSGPACFSIEKLLCAIQKFEQTLCNGSWNTCHSASCDSGQKSCDGGGKVWCGHSESCSPCHDGISECTPRPTCETARAAA